MRSEDYLAHHGIKGMRWGVRRQRPSGGGGRIFGKPKKTIPAENSFSKDYKDMKNMTNKELRNAITRLELEKQYSSLVRNDVSNGRRMVNSILRDVATQTVSDLLKEGAMTGARAGIDYARDYARNRS